MLFAILLPLTNWILHHRRILRAEQDASLEYSVAARVTGADLYSLRQLSNYVHKLLYA